MLRGVSGRTRRGRGVGQPAARYYFTSGQFSGFPIAVSRSSTGATVGPDGLWTSAPANSLRQHYYPDPNGFERRNFIRNDQMVGALATDGVELVPGGDFATNPASNGYTFIVNGAGVAAWDSAAQRLNLMGDGAAASAIDLPPLTTVVGRTYNLRADVTTGLTLQVGPTQGSSALLSAGGIAGTGLAFSFTATTTTTWVRFIKTVAAVATIDNVSVKWAGVIPNLWAGAFTGNGIAHVLSAATIENGVDVTDHVLTGTSTLTLANVFYFDGAMTPATTGQAWTASLFAKITGALPGDAVIYLVIREYDSASAFLRQTLVPIPTGSTLQRTANPVTLGASTAFIQAGLRLTSATNGGLTFNSTVRIGLPQLENLPYATNVIKTSGAAASVVGGDPTWNKVRNAVGAGAVVGTIGSGGVLPTNWASFVATGLAWAVQRVGGNRIALRLFGTATGSAASAVYFETTTGAAGANGQTWTQSLGHALDAGSLANVASTQLFFNYHAAGGAFSSAPANVNFTPGAAIARTPQTATIADASAAFIRPGFSVNTVAGPVDLTLLLELPQLERSPVATTPRANAPGIYDAPPGVPTGNLIRSSAFTGGVNGSPGTAPSTMNLQPAAGLTRTLAFGVDSLGREYCEVTLAGTATATDTGLFLDTNIPVIAGQTVFSSALVSMVGGSMANVTLVAMTHAFTGTANTFTNGGAITPSVVAQFANSTADLVPTTATTLQPYILVRTALAAINITLRITIPQSEPGDRRGPYVRTAGTAILSDYTRARSGGVWHEETRTNYCTNPRMVGFTPGVVGSGGVAGTGWTIGQSISGLTSTIVSTFTEGGIDFVRVRVAGTATGTSPLGIKYAATGAITGFTGAMTHSAFWRMAAGSTAGLVVQTWNQVVDSLAASVSDVQVNMNSTLANGRINRIVSTVTPSGGTGPYTSNGASMLLYPTNGAVIDITVDVGWPQLELGAHASTPILPAAGQTGVGVRSAELITTTSPAFPDGEAILYARGTPMCPNTYPANQVLASLSDTSGGANRISLYRAANSNNGAVVVSSPSFGAAAAAQIPVGVSAKLAASIKSGAQDFAQNGVASGTAAVAGSLPNMPTLYIGTRGDGALSFNGLIEEVEVYTKTAAANIQALTTQ